jgi:hypothetical protein
MEKSLYFLKNHLILSIIASPRASPTPPESGVNTREAYRLKFEMPPTKPINSPSIAK